MSFGREFSSSQATVFAAASSCINNPKMDEMITEQTAVSSFWRNFLLLSLSFSLLLYVYLSAADDKSQPPTGMTSDTVWLWRRSITAPHSIVGKCKLWVVDCRLNRALIAPPHVIDFPIVFLSFPFFSLPHFAFLSSCQLFFNCYLSWPVRHSINLFWVHFSRARLAVVCARHGICIYTVFDSGAIPMKEANKKTKKLRPGIQMGMGNESRTNVSAEVICMRKWLAAHVYRRKSPSIWE